MKTEYEPPKLIEKPVYKSERWLRDKYLKEELLQREIAELCNAKQLVISYWIRKFNINKEKPRYTDKKWLKQKRTIEGLTLIEIGKICDVNPSTIHTWTKKLNIKEKKKEQPKYKDKDWLENKYKSEGLSTIDIGNICNVCPSSIGRQMKKFNIDTVNGRGDLKNTLRNKKWLYKKYHKDQLTYSEIADQLSCGISTVSRWLDKLDIESRGIPSGEEHSFWKGGISDLNNIIRASAENINWKKEVLARDEYKCVWCNSSSDLHVDHIKPFSYIMEDEEIETIEDAYESEMLFDVDNGRVLCEECHKKTPTYGNRNRISKEERQRLDKLARLESVKNKES